MSGLLLDVAVQPSSVGPPVRAARYLRGGPQVGAAATEGARGARLALPRADFQLRPVPSGFAPQEQEYQQALLLVVALAGLGLGLSLIFIAVYLIRFCCCRPPEPPGAKSPPPGGGCVTWSCIAALLVALALASVSMATARPVMGCPSSALHCCMPTTHSLPLTTCPVAQSLATPENALPRLQAHPCAQVLEMVERLDEAVRTELTTLEEVLTQRTELVAATRGARRQAEAVAQQLQGLAFWQGVPLSPVQVAEDVSFVEEYRWLAYVLLLLLELLVCLFTLLGLAKQSKWLVIVMTVMSLLVLVLSWGSMGLEAATAVGLSDFCSSPDTYILNLTREETGLGSDILNYYFLCNQAVSNPFQQRLTVSQRALANIHSQLQGLEREAVPQFPSAQKPLLSLEETLNVTEGNFHQLVALLHCRGLHKDYGAALRGLCEDALEGLLYLLLFSLLSAGALATALCSLPRAWALFPPRNPSASCSGSHLSEPFLHARLEPVPHLRSFPSCRRRPH
nr:protein tweety homolog 1 isoform X1 [Globicephala melas]XP_030707549.1 protein tweety homolog 1 isoform X1 [Globicephala melas]XP_030707550.1 protein tweety homolog 1 isoform X1 [Globicephala melas]XP_030707554.1 protein tweety homolog 1 isoform X1 [Globicephala melas]XP_030707555.1 protein tweety homolog 1 isoform X1 [Globicephala melas]XP_030707556.1 protein tweety homolog 1 isoform X1 [Globicephala melas]